MKRLCFFLTALVFLAPNVSALNLIQLRSAVRDLARDNYQNVDEHTVLAFSDFEINDLLNEAQRDFQNNAWLYQGAFQMDFSSGVAEYPLPADYVTTVRVVVSSMALTQVSFQGLDQDNTNWTIITSTPTEYYIDPYVEGAPPSIGFWPKPKFTTTSGVVAIQYVRQVPILFFDADVPFGGNAEFLPYHDALADFAASRLLYLSGNTDKAVYLMTMYAARAKMARANINNQPNWLPGATGARGTSQSGDQ